MKVLGFAAYSGNGKTTLIEGLIPLLAARNLKVSVIKHSHHGFEADRPGKDSDRYRRAGATGVQVIFGRAPPIRTCRCCWQGWPRPTWCSSRVSNMPRFPKSKVHRMAAGTRLLFPDDRRIIALVTDAPVVTALPRFGLKRPRRHRPDLWPGSLAWADRLQIQGKPGIINTMKPDDSRIATIEVLYFARLREVFGRDREQVELPGAVRDVAGLTAWLRSRGDPWERELASGKPVRIRRQPGHGGGGHARRARGRSGLLPAGNRRLT